MSNPKLTGIVQGAPNKSKGFDADEPISKALSQTFYQQGYKFCLRYISLGSESPGDLTYDEANQILEGGLALMPVQHVLEPNWFPNTALGQQHGENAAVNSDRIGFPPKVNVWCDLEGVSSSATPQDVIDYCNAWYDAVAQWGYIPGLYVGYNTGLTGEQLEDLKFQSYWKSESNVPPGITTGYQMVQTNPPEYANGMDVNGINIDPDTTYIDNAGGRPQWLINSNFA